MEDFLGDFLQDFGANDAEFGDLLAPSFQNSVTLDQKQQLGSNTSSSNRKHKLQPKHAPQPGDWTISQEFIEEEFLINKDFLNNDSLSKKKEINEALNMDAQSPSSDDEVADKDQDKEDDNELDQNPSPITTSAPQLTTARIENVKWSGGLNYEKEKLSSAISNMEKKENAVEEKSSTPTFYVPSFTMKSQTVDIADEKDFPSFDAAAIEEKVEDKVTSKPVKHIEPVDTTFKPTGFVPSGSFSTFSTKKQSSTVDISAALDAAKTPSQTYNLQRSSNNSVPKYNTTIKSTNEDTPKPSVSAGFKPSTNFKIPTGSTTFNTKTYSIPSQQKPIETNNSGNTSSNNQSGGTFTPKRNFKIGNLSGSTSGNSYKTR